MDDAITLFSGGNRLVKRIVIREKAKLQAEFLQELYQQDFGRNMIFRGGAALHGVYLHARWSEDMDFFASPDISHRFVQFAQTRGLNVEARGVGLTPIYVGSGKVCRRVEIPIDVAPKHLPEEEFLTSHWDTFSAVTGERVQVLTYSIGALLARKLRYVVRRSYAVDFFDLWIGAQCNTVCTQEIARIVRGREAQLDQDDAERFRADAAIRSMMSLRNNWDSELRDLMQDAPKFDHVVDMLAPWLTQVDGLVSEFQSEKGLASI